MATTRVGVPDEVPDGLVFVSSVSDFPDPVAGVITTPAGQSYWIVGSVAIGSNRMVVGKDCAFFGANAESARITANSLGAAEVLLTSTEQFKLQNITLETTGEALDLNGGASGADKAIDWSDVNFRNCAVGTIANYSNAIFRTMGFLNSGGLVLDGDLDTVAFSDTLFEVPAGGTAISLANGLSISRRLRLRDGAMVVLPGETGLSVDAAATLPDEGLILRGVSFAGGGTYLSGVSHDDDIALFSGNSNVTDTRFACLLSMRGNTTATTIATVGVDVKIEGTTTGEAEDRFTHTNGRMTYNGAEPRKFALDVSVTVDGTRAYRVHVAINGAIVPTAYVDIDGSGASSINAASIPHLAEIQPLDYVEVWIRNTVNNSDPTVTELTLRAIEAL